MQVILNDFKTTINNTETSTTTRNLDKKIKKQEGSMIDLFQSNKEMQKLLKAPEKTILSELPGIQKLRDIQQKIHDKKFSWEGVKAEEFSQIRLVTQLTNLTDKEAGKNNCWLLSEANFYKKYIPLGIIQDIVNFPYKASGLPAYDSALRVHCDLIQIFMVFHLKHDFRFSPQMDGEKYQISNPLSRNRTRAINRGDPILKKYFYEEFNIKNFISQIFDDYFLNVSWRYLGEEHIAHRLIFQILDFTFSIGLWKKEDVQFFLKIFASKSENLVNLQNVCETDAKNNVINTDFRRKLQNLFKDIKAHLCNCVLHIIILINDASFSQSLAWTNEKGTQGKEWDGVYFTLQRENDTLVQVLMRFAMKTAQISTDSEGEKEKAIDYSNINNIMMMVFDINLDLYLNGMGLLDEQYVDYYAKKSWKQYEKELIQIKKQVIQSLDEISKLETIELDPSSDSSAIKQRLEASLEPLFNFISKADKKGDMFNCQMILGDHNMIRVLMTIISIEQSIKDQKEDANQDDNKIQDLIVIHLKKLSLICSNNQVCQSILFSGIQNDFLWDLISNQTMLGIMVLRSIFDSTNEIFYVAPELFDLLLINYTQKLEEFFSEDFTVASLKSKKGKEDSYDENENETLRINDLSTIYCYNLFFESVVKLHQQSNVQKRAFDMEITVIIRKIIKNQILPFLKKSENALKNKDKGNDDHLSSNYNQLLGGFHTKFLGEGKSNFINLLNSNIVDVSLLKGISYELCFSFLKLFNKMSRQFILVSTYRLFQDEVKKNSVSKYTYLSTFSIGIDIVTEIFEIIKIYGIFPNDKLLGLDRVSFNIGYISYQETILPANHSSKYVVNLIGLTFKFLNAFKKNGLKTPENELRIKQFIFKGMLSTIYKYLMGINSVFYVDTRIPNSNILEKLEQRVMEVKEIIKDNLDLLEEFLDSSFPGRTTIINFTDSIPQSYMDTDQMELNEILYPSVYNMRILINVLCYFIKNAFPSKYEYILERYIRHSEVPVVDFKSYIRPLDLISDKESSIQQNQKNKIIKIQLGKNKNSKKPAKPKSDSPYFQQYNHLMTEYYSLKETWLNKIGPENIMYSFLDNNKVNIPNLLKFSTEMIMYSLVPGKVIREGSAYDRKKDEESDNEDYIIRQFFQTESLFSYIKLLSHLFNQFEAIKVIFYCMLCNKPSKNQKKQAMDYLCINSNEAFQNFYSIHESSRASMSLVCVILYSFDSYLRYKVFKDRQWYRMFTFYDTVTDFFQNCCENNAIYFKEYFSHWEPTLPGDFESGIEGLGPEKSFIFTLYMRMEIYWNSNLAWFKDQPCICSSDCTGYYRLHIKNVQLITEMVNGPCDVNQRKIYQQRNDIWMGIAFRVIDDIDSNFYALKDSVLDYVLSLSEGEGYVELSEAAKKKPGAENPYLVTEHFATNFTPKMIVDTIIGQLKRLSMSIKFKYSPAFRSAIMNRVAKSEIKKAVAKNGGPLSEDEKSYIKTKYGLGKVSKFERLKNKQKKEKEITQEMCDLYKFKDYKELLEMYKRRDEFVEHPIIELCTKLYSILVRLSNPRVSTSSSLFLNDIKNSLKSHFGSDLELDTHEQPKKLSKKGALTEELVFLMFIIKISKKIEISVKLPNQEKAINKFVYFKRTPATFYLEEKMKRQFFNKVNLESKRLDFLKHFPLFSLEMKNNRQVYQSSPLFYKLTNNDTFNYLKIFLWLCSMVINIMVLFTYELGTSTIEERGNRSLSAGDWEYPIMAISAIFGCFSFMIFCLWLLTRYRLVVEASILKFKLEYPFKSENDILNTLKIRIIDSFLKYGSPVSFFCHALFAFLGILLNPFFHSLQLLLFINISRTARYVVQAVFMHIDQLLTTLLFALFFIYTYSTLNAHFFSDIFEDNTDYCRTLRSCFSYLVNFGLRNGGGIADIHETYDYGSWKFFFKTFFDLSFFIIINVIALNIIFGIIIDTFGEMRGEILERRDSLSSSCFICENDEPTFKADEVHYNTHVKVDHDIWAYVYYIMHLEYKNKQEYDGNEISVWENFINNDDSFMPLNRTLYLKNQDDEEEEEEEEPEDQEEEDKYTLEEKISMMLDQKLAIAVTQFRNNPDQKQNAQQQQNFEEIRQRFDFLHHVIKNQDENLNNLIRALRGGGGGGGGGEGIPSNEDNHVTEKKEDTSSDFEPLKNETGNFQEQQNYSFIGFQQQL